MEIHQIPALNAILNSIATVLIVSGLICIKKGNEKAHRSFMTAALFVSVFFLAGYLYHKWSVNWQNRSIGAEGTLKTIYLLMLLTHVLLAMAIVPLVLRTFFLAIKGRYESHKNGLDGPTRSGFMFPLQEYWYTFRYMFGFLL